MQARIYVVIIWALYACILPLYALSWQINNTQKKTNLLHTLCATPLYTYEICNFDFYPHSLCVACQYLTDQLAYVPKISIVISSGILWFTDSLACSYGTYDISGAAKNQGFQEGRILNVMYTLSRNKVAECIYEWMCETCAVCVFAHTLTHVVVVWSNRSHCYLLET